MTKEEAIAWYKRITAGEGVDRYKHFGVMLRGRIAASLWDDGVFILGMEYGVMLALIEVFGLTNEDLGQSRDEVSY